MHSIEVINDGRGDVLAGVKFPQAVNTVNDEHGHQVGGCTALSAALAIAVVAA